MNDLALKTPDIYSITCESAQVYIGQTGHLIETRFKNITDTSVRTNPRIWRWQNTASFKAIGQS
jgi:hypothetical protein